LNPTSSDEKLSSHSGKIIRLFIFTMVLII
jgi:hypothetical protein